MQGVTRCEGQGYRSLARFTGQKEDLCQGYGGAAFPTKRGMPNHLQLIKEGKKDA